MKLSEVFTLYEEDKRLAGYSPNTLKAYALQMRLLIRSLGDINIGEITLFHLRRYLTEESERLKPSTIGARIRFIRSVFRWAHEEGLISINPASRLREPKQGSRIPKTLTEEQIEEMRLACRTDRERALIEFFYATGCRIGEVAALNRTDIDFETRTVIVRGKGDKEREVYFTVKCAIVLRRYLRGRKDDDPALFVTERAPRRLSIAQMRGVIKDIAKRAEVDVNVYPHRLRHSFATHLLNNDAPLDAIQELLGHTKIETTRLYAQLTGEKRRDIYRRYFSG